MKVYNHILLNNILFFIDIYEVEGWLENVYL